MLFLSADACHPIEFVSCGNLVSQEGFLHPKRELTSFVFILILEGTLQIQQRNRKFVTKKNEFLLLFPNTLHKGLVASPGFLSYLWVHFYVTDPGYHVYDHRTLLRQHFANQSHNITSVIPKNRILIPEFGQFSAEHRSLLLFNQLLDLAKRENYEATWACHYALNSLLLEVTVASFRTNYLTGNEIPIAVLDVMEWIRTHYEQPLTVASIAELFDYHPTYLSNLFKTHTGRSLLNYINATRINIAKNLLSNKTLSIFTIASMCGFSDEKYFMKQFRKHEGMTPTQYRKAFHQKRVNIT